MTRFAQWPAWVARLTLALLAGLVIAASSASEPAKVAHAFSDLSLYQAIANRVSAGEDYYSAAALEHRKHGYPMTPAVVFREPTLSWWLALLRTDALREAALIGLVLVTGVAIRNALEREGMPTWARIPAMLVLATGLGIVFARRAFLLHESWAAILIALSLALYSPEKWRGSVVVGVVACLFRELAIPYLVAMASFAALERRWPEVRGWLYGAAVAGAALAAHLWIASQLRQPGDLASGGWLGFGGIPFLVETARWNFPLIIAPPWLVALMAGLGLIGLIGARNPVAARGALVVGGYMSAFLVLGRSDNSYWGLLYAPILPLGVVLAPPALLDLGKRAMPLPRVARRL